MNIYGETVPLSSIVGGVNLFIAGYIYGGMGYSIIGGNVGFIAGMIDAMNAYHDINTVNTVLLIGM